MGACRPGWGWGSGDVSAPPNSPTRCRGQLADWRELHAAAGITWLLAAPLICSEHLHGRLLGALVVAGRGEGPSVDPQWLREFACEVRSAPWQGGV